VENGVVQQSLDNDYCTATRENFIGDKISINPIIPFIAEVR
jgi:hypothetical protein